ncbi:RDD family protein [Streptomyces sp. NK08204]|uniref:RDD family protein n=1 Tax=Streptomyces sp. NK08204 TaxID=2873260 RepID=UPI001CED046C|nr:RDD family protein [Streptomyces sp. NK08204]
MSAPTPAPGDDRPREGYYPDPSIPGYVRYWNGASWVPGTSRPAPKDGEPLTPPPGVRPAAPAVEETGPHFFDEDPQPEPAGRETPGSAESAGRAAPWATDPRVPMDTPAREEGTTPDSGGTFVFRRPPVSPPEDGTMTFRRPEPGPGPHGGAPGGGTQGPTGASSAGAQGKAAQAAVAPSVPHQGGPQLSGPQQGGVPQQGVPHQGGPRLSGPQQGVPQQGMQPQGASAQSVVPQAAAPVSPVTTGPGGGQTSWAQQVHQLAGAGDEQPVAPWKPPVEDPFQAAARRQAAARPAGLGRRLAARLIDSLVVGAVTAAAAVPLGVRAADHVQQKIDQAKQSGHTVTVWLLDGTTGASLGIVLAVLLVFGALYEALPTAKWGRTLGKKLCGLEVRDIEGHEPPSFGLALRRWLVYSVPGLLGIGLVGVLWCLFDRPWHQCWHDKAAHTFVAG